jgi:tRNA G18 (ribose-2'-O)-methylase SpoU
MKRKLSFLELQDQQVKNVSSSVRRRPISLILDDIRSLHNVGAIFRTADGAYIEHIYLCGITGTPPRNEIRKTSLGAEETVPWSYHQDPEEAIQMLKEQDYQVVVLEQTTQSYDYRKAPYRFPLCLIVGHEYNGVRDSLVTMADIAVEIPMKGMKLSLNVSVACGIAMYELCTRWEDFQG